MHVVQVRFVLRVGEQTHIRFLRFAVASPQKVAFTKVREILFKLLEIIVDNKK